MGAATPEGEVRWLATAPYVEPHGPRRPWGRWHLKPEGGIVTACGLPTLDWYIFWAASERQEWRSLCDDCGGFARPATPDA